MKAMKKTVLATAVLMSLGVSAAEAAITALNLTSNGSFLMYDGSDPANAVNFNGVSPTFTSYIGDPAVAPSGTTSFSNGGIVDNGNGAAGDPMTGAMSMDFGAGTGTATIVPGAAFFGSAWSAHDITMALSGTNVLRTSMLFDWGAEDNGTSCGVTNCDIHAYVDLTMTPQGGTTNAFNVAQVGDSFSMATTSSLMPDGPFMGFQPTFSGIYTVTSVPVPATAWIVGSGLLGLLGVGATRRKKRLTA